MKASIKKGLSFGLTSGIITTLGLIVGLYSGTASKSVVLGGILTIAIADSLSDALGVHMSEESVKDNSHQAVWEATIATFLTKFIFALSFVIPVILFELRTAVIVSVIWGFAALLIINYRMARSKGEKPLRVIAEHVSIATVVVIATYFVGNYISLIFK